MAAGTWERLDDCVKCGARCCRHVALAIDKPTCKRDYDNIRWYLMHQDVQVSVDHDGDWLLTFRARCKNLTTENKCARYAARPDVCRNYPDENSYCEYESQDPPHTDIFESAEEFEAYLERMGIDWRWKRKRG